MTTSPTFDSVTINSAFTTPTLTATTVSATTVNATTLTGAWSGDASGSTTLATGSTTSRTSAARAADVYNVRDWGISPSNSSTTNLTNFQALATAVTALNGAGAEIYFPAGSYHFDAGTVTFCGNGITFRGAGRQATLLFPANTTTDFLRFKPTRTNQSRMAGLRIRDFRIFFTSNTHTAGAAMVLERPQFACISDIQIDGAFVALDVIGGLSNQYSNTIIEGDNTTSGSTYAKFRRSVTTVNTSADTPSGSVLPFTDTSGIYVGDTVTGTNIAASSSVTSLIENVSVTLNHAITGDVASGAAITFTSFKCSENFVSKANWRSTSKTYTNGLQVSSCDGMWISDSHIGFTNTGPALLVTAINTDDSIAGVNCSNTEFDTGGTYGVETRALGGFTGENASHMFVGCRFIVSGNAGVFLNDSSVDTVIFSGCNWNTNKQYAVNIQAGTNIGITGGGFLNNNTSASTFTNCHIGGTATYVTVNGVMFHSGGTGFSTVPYHIDVADTADFVNVGPCIMNGATTANFNLTTTGTHINLLPGITDTTSNPWTFNPTRTDSTHQVLQADDGTAMFKISTTVASPTAPVGWAAQSNGVATGAQLFTYGSTNASGTIQVSGTGTLNLGTSTNSSVTFKTYYATTVGNALTAAGTTRTDALQLAAQYNRVTTAAASTGVILPVGIVGMEIIIDNGGANAIKVYANNSETIDGTAGSTGVTLTNTKRCIYIFVAANTWISYQLGVVSA
jgi:hypothetical protein